MTSDSNADVRQLRKRSNSSQPIYNFKAQKIIRESRKCVDLFEKYFPFFLEQQNLLNELRKSVKESEMKKTADQQDNASTHSQQDEHHSDVIISPPVEIPIENHVNEEDPGTGNIFECQFIVENTSESNDDDDVIECKLLPDEHSPSSPSLDIVECEHATDAIPSTAAEDYITLISSEDYVEKSTRQDSELVSYDVSGGDCEIMREYLESSRQEFGNGEIAVSNIADVTYDILPEDSSLSSLAVWDSRLVSVDTGSVLSDDAIDCELLREEDSDKYSEDSIEYNILYVSENASNDNNTNSIPTNSYQIHQNVVDDRETTDSELTYETDTVSDQINDKSSSVPSFINFIDNCSEQGQEDQINTSSPIHTNTQTRQLTSTQEFDNFPCQFCTSHFNTSADLECHLNTHRGTVLSAPFVPADNIPNKRYKVNPSKSSPNAVLLRFYCLVCLRPYQSKNGLRHHMKFHRSDPFDDIFDVPNSKVKSVTIQKPTVKCFYCSYETTDKILLLDHLIYHKIKKQQYSCPECECRVYHQKLIIFHIYDKHREFFDSHNLNQRSPLVGPLTKVIQRGSNLIKTSKKQKVSHHNLKRSNKLSKKQTFSKKGKFHQTHFSRDSDNKTGNLILQKPEPLLQEPCSPKGSKPEIISNLFDCIYCIKDFPTKDELHSHLFTHIEHIQSDTNLFLCPICVHPYKLPRSVIKHYKTLHQESIPLLSLTPDSPKDDEDYIVSRSSSLSS